MSNIIQTFRNIFKIEDLRKRILYTLLLLLVYRFGTHIVLPGINGGLIKASGFTSQGQGGLLGMINMFAGGAFSNASILALGIMPYISASIIIQLLTVVIPTFQRMQKEGESGRRRLNQITRYLTILVTIAQAQGYITYLAAQLPAQAIYPFTGAGIPFIFRFSATVLLTAGTLFVMWLGEKITDKGIGNGISLIIMIGIIARLPIAIAAEFSSRMSVKGGGIFALIIEIIVLIAVILFTILLIQGTRKIPVQYAKRVVGNKQYGGVRQYLPLKVNAAGVMPIIFAQAIMFLPITIAGFANYQSGGWFVTAFSNFNGFWYNLTFSVLIIVFTYFYTAITFNPQQIADELKKNNGFIPGIKPGKKTAEYIDTIMSRITLPGSIFLAIVAILPAIVSNFGITSQFAQFYGGTSLLILVGVVLDTLQQIESHLLMRHYDGFMKKGKLKGRSVYGGA
ncbi:MAG TPA: preprotein translocase subunit SecY [Bacteroidales bacterium]|nr:preprotein translocase subunit SecY [Bacteroidales bacterium]OQC44783.1 MAG: preprotein translocase subunit SecY [Bacteroidetes bacterium ADurb.Bin035]HNT70096.1 preprotein translocase subunit SecY [Bacteroidales bacterium]HNY75140.1 preprotein translocase subunit SecY [Bacteroidales bacterium]HOC39777.1 preprotein translocase subunit SecY [Bacteroidales bacterium]